MFVFPLACKTETILHPAGDRKQMEARGDAYLQPQRMQSKLVRDNQFCAVYVFVYSFSFIISIIQSSFLSYSCTCVPQSRLCVSV